MSDHHVSAAGLDAGPVPAQRVASETSAPLVQAHDLAKTFDVSPPWLNRVLEGKPRQLLKAVDGVSFEIEKGTTLALVGLSLNIPQCQGTSRRIVEQSLNRGTGSQKEAFTSPQHLFVVVGRRRCIQFGSGLVVNLERLHENFAKSSCMTVGPSRKTAFPSLTS